MSEAAAAVQPQSAAPTNAPAQGPEITDTTPVPAIPEQRSSKQRAQWDRALAKLHGKAPAAAPEAAPAATLDGVAPAAETATEPPAQPVESTPAEAEQRPGESNAKHEARLAKMAADMLTKDKQLLERTNAEKRLQADLEKLRADLKARDDEIAARDKDVLRALKPHGGYDAVTKRVLAGELKAPDAIDDVKTAVTETTSRLEQELAQLRAEREAEKAELAEKAKAQQAQESRAKDLTTVQTLIKSSADRFPVAAVIADPEYILEECYRHQINDPTKVLEHLEQNASAQAEALLLNEKTLARLMASPKIREKLAAEFQKSKATEQSRKSPVSSEGPRALAADVVSAPTTPTNRPRSKEDRLKSALSILRNGKGG